MLLHFGSWRLIFVVVLPIAVLVGFFGFRNLENVGEATKSPISWLSVVLAATGFSTFVYGLSKVGKAPWLEPTLLIGGGAVLVAAFDRLGISTGIDLKQILIASEEVMRPIIPRLPVMDRASIIQGKAGPKSRTKDR